MADIFDKDKRSEVMSRIRGKNTKVEKIVFRYLRQQGVYFQKHYRNKKLGINIDIALPRKKKAIFIDGDFWHGRQLDRLVMQKGEDDFWTKKIRRNMERDIKQEAILKKNGWNILRMWESEINRKRTQEETLEQIKKFLTT